MTDNDLRVLHVEDNPDDRLLLSAYLSDLPDHGLVLTQVERLDQALQKGAEDSFDAALLDLNLPDSQGLNTFKTFSDRFPELPIVLLTVTDIEDMAVKAVRAGAQDYLIKDQLSGPLLVRAIRYAVERKNTEVKLSRTKEQLEQWVEERTHDLLIANRILLSEIDERKKVQTSLAESRLMLRTVTDNIPALVAFVGKDGRYRFVNKEYEKTFGLPVKSIVGMHARELQGEQYDRVAKAHVEQALAGQAVTYEIHAQVPATKEFRWFEVVYIPSLQQGQEDGYFVLGSDITERKLDAERLREQRQLLQDILDGMGAAVFFIDVDQYKVVKVNEVAQTLLGLSEEEMLGSNCYEFICMQGHKKPAHGCPAVGKTTMNVEFKLARPDGKVVPVTKTVLPVTIEGRPHHVAILFDITERKAIERQLAYAQKLESVGQLAAGIAHEINTPIQYIGSNLQYFQGVYAKLMPVFRAYSQLTACLEGGSDAKECSLAARKLAGETDINALLDEIPQALQDALEGVERVTSIVMAMKKFSHPDVEERKLVNINDAINNTVTIARNEWKYVADVKTELDDQLPLVNAVPGDINQVLLNILVNAAHAIREKVGESGAKGLITVRTRALTDRVEIAITDTGCGIPVENRERIFDPFFTTKEVGKGTGQGLAISLAVIDKHGGSIDFESAPGQGTTFYVRLLIEENA